MIKQFYFKQFNLNKFAPSLNVSSIWTIDMILSGATFPGQSEPRSYGSEGIFSIPQSFSISGASVSDRSKLYQDTR